MSFMEGSLWCCSVLPADNKFVKDDKKFCGRQERDIGKRKYESSERC